MKCPECKSKIKKGISICPSCEYKLEAEDFQKHKKRKRTRMWIIIASVVAFLIGIALLIYLPTSIYFNDASIDADVLEYGDDLNLSLEYEGVGVLFNDIDVPVYIDGNLAETFNFAFNGDGIKTENFRFKTENVYEPGKHVLEVEDVKIPFKILTPAKIDSDWTYDENAILLVGKDYNIEYDFSNTGESKAEMYTKIEFKDKIIATEDFTLNGNSEKDFEFAVSSDIAGTYNLLINDDPFPLTFYNTERPENGTKLIENTVKGYGYFMLTNKTGSDIVVYLSGYDNIHEPVAARYIRDGETHKVNSIVHGQYWMFIQKGDSWIPEINGFAENEETHRIFDALELKSNVYGGYGTYHYYEFDIDQETLDSYCTTVETIPVLPN
jgi:hypothetical protein